MYIATTVTALMTLGQAVGGADPVGATGSAAKIESIWDFMVKGGPMMIPIVFCSLVALTVVIERLVSLRRAKVLPPPFVRGLKQVLEESEGDKRKALDYCALHTNPLANVFVAGIKRLGGPLQLLEKRVQEAGEREVQRLRKYLRLLSVIASITPLMGLLGTIFGMIRAFQTVATSAETLGKAELLATGIYEAMITTAAGLLVAIPVLISYHWISAKIDHLVTEMDALTVEFVEQYAESPPPPRDQETQAVASEPPEEPQESGDGRMATPAVTA